ncbi:transposase [Bdellovibrionales bacterium]|nr:transposase [Bdellovibrionales bacterium]
MRRSYNTYSEEFKQSVVKKALIPGGPSKLSIAEEHGINPSNISKWIKRYGTPDHMNIKKQKSPHNWSPEEKLNAVEETSGMSESDLGEYIRKHGLHSSHLKKWRDEILTALKSKFHPKKRDPQTVKLERENKTLKKNLNRKEKALAEAAALLILKKKADDYFSDEE